MNSTKCGLKQRSPPNHSIETPDFFHRSAPNRSADGFQSDFTNAVGSPPTHAAKSPALGRTAESSNILAPLLRANIRRCSRKSSFRTLRSVPPRRWPSSMTTSFTDSKSSGADRSIAFAFSGVAMVMRPSFTNSLSTPLKREPP